MGESLRILALCVGAAVVYGVLHDQVTARVSVEYFTIGHPKVIESTEPTRLALFWGVAATWWVGASLALPMILAARAGSEPKRSARSLVDPVLTLLVGMGLLAAFAGLAGKTAAQEGLIVLVEPLASEVPADRHVDFITALWAHLASYASGFFGGTFMAWRIWRGRKRVVAAR